MSAVVPPWGRRAARETLLRLEDMGREPWSPETDEAQTMTARDVLLGSAFQVTETNEAAGRSFGDTAW